MAEEGFNPQDYLTLPPNWKDDPETKCFINLDTGRIFRYSGDFVDFVDAYPNQNAETKIKFEEKPSTTKDSSEEATVAMELKDKIKLELASCANVEDSSISLEVTTLTMETVPEKDGRSRKNRCGACGVRGHNRQTCSKTT
ncbi:hypothetical protein MTR_7g076420 [Medicago truncatula]|uniref:Zinc finger, CCHC-type n=1 Tax=Medicago truncatula TaxID=3880 RepID=A2Q3N2_MEDTR|nr:Zinc finger, CCHC-type [Medicago truncatula]AES80078.1 hypothetical protein MTR_7g076420 [Medicago truncatula]